MALIVRIAGRLGLSVLLILCCMGGSFAQKRFALVIGNYNYKLSVGPLKTPQRDQELITKALADIHFDDVVSKENVTRTDIKYLVDVLAHKLEAAGNDAIGFLYYSGHGAANPDDHMNYLIPTEADKPEDERFWYGAVAVDDIVRTLTEKAPRASIFIVFDACRSELHLPSGKSPLASKGFDLEDMHQKPGVFIAYSTSPNTEAPDVGESGALRDRWQPNL